MHKSFLIYSSSNEVLELSDGIDDMGNIVWQLALCLLLCWAVNFLVLIKGISSLGKVKHMILLSSAEYIKKDSLIYCGIQQIILSGKTWNELPNVFFII